VIDSHCHLADDVFAGDLGAVVSRAREAGLERVLAILEAGNAGEEEQARRLAALWPETRTAVGVHPHAAHEYADSPQRAVEVVRGQIGRTPSVRAVGEIGLDYHYDYSPRDVQQQVFGGQLALARELGLPVVIHTREADDDTLAMLRGAGAGLTGVLHCFTGTEALARAALDLGFYISLAGIVTFPKAAELREVARMVPLDRLLVETDSPFLAPVPHRGKRNEPALVAETVKAVAALQGVEPGELARETAANFHRLFRP
jgi:TatD DNase family protein